MEKGEGTEVEGRRAYGARGKEEEGGRAYGDPRQQGRAMRQPVLQGFC